MLSEVFFCLFVIFIYFPSGFESGIWLLIIQFLFIAFLLLLLYDSGVKEGINRTRTVILMYLLSSTAKVAIRKNLDNNLPFSVHSFIISVKW